MTAKFIDKFFFNLNLVVSLNISLSKYMIFWAFYLMIDGKGAEFVSDWEENMLFTKS